MNKLFESIDNLEDFVLDESSINEDVDSSYVGLPESEEAVDNRYNQVINTVENALGIKFEECEDYNRFGKWRAEAKIELGNHTINISIYRELPSGIYNNSYMLISASDTEKFGKDEEVAPGLTATKVSETRDIGEPYSYGIWKGNTVDKAKENGNLDDLINAIKSRVDSLK